jgi:Sec-independent protein translocase protein TatA
VRVGTEILFLLMLGVVVPGPKRMHSVLGSFGRAKAELDRASRESNRNSSVRRSEQHSDRNASSQTCYRSRRA